MKADFCKINSNYVLSSVLFRCTKISIDRTYAKHGNDDVDDDEKLVCKL